MYMNDINQIVFDVYKSVRDMDYSKNEKKNIVKQIAKLGRYLISGYIFSLRNVRERMNDYNVFQPTEKKYPDVKFVVYTVSTGRYDEIKEPIYTDEKIDYFIFTDQAVPAGSIWKKVAIPDWLKSGMNSLAQARYLKTHPHEFFQEYDYSMFIDGNVRISCDIMPLLYSMLAKDKIMAIHKHQVRNCVYDEAKAIYAAGKASIHELRAQVNHFRTCGFPANFGLFETNIVIRKHNVEKCVNVMNTWWEEMEKYTKRDQMSFTYALWRNGENAETVFSLGNNSRLNPYFIVSSHSSFCLKQNSR